MTTARMASPTPSIRPYTLLSILKGGVVGGVAAASASIILWLVTRPLGVTYIVPFGPTQELAPLPAFAFISVCLAAAVGATIVFALLNRFTANPARLFQVVAVIVLILSFGPIIAIPADLGTKIMLAVMHVAAAAAITWGLVSFGHAR